MAKFFFLLMLILYGSPLFCQETNNYPNWVFDKKFYNSNEYAIGISDPDLDSITAFEQAKLRALINFGIYNNSQFGSLTSVSMGNEQENNYDATSIETILFSNIIKGNFNLKDSLTTYKKEFTKYGECCVVIKLFSNAELIKANNFTYRIVRRTGFQKENNIFPVFIDEIEINAIFNDSLKLNNIISREKGKFKINSRFGPIDNTKKLKVQNIYRKYSLDALAESETDISYYTPLTFGLWPAYIFELQDQISFNASLSKNRANQLITLNQGNILKNDINKSLNELILSSKKMVTEPLNLSIEDISIKYNSLKINTEQSSITNSINDNVTSDYSKINFRRADKKELKKFVKGNWHILGNLSLEDAFSQLKALELSNKYLHSSASLDAQDLGNGILKGLQIARSEIENQLKSDVKTLNKVKTDDDNNIAVQTSKTSMDTESKIIKPTFIFYRKLSKNYYQLQIILFYKY